MGNPKDKTPSPVIPESLNRWSPSRPLRARAFSLVELLAVVGIVAILSVAAVPVLRGLGGGQSSRATAQILVSALEQARTAAILSGTNAYLAIPATNFSETNYHRAAYAVIRPSVDLDGNDRDDFQTNAPHPGWILLSKWERLPGDLVFSANRINTLTNLSVSNLAVPRNPRWEGNLRGIGFTPSGGLMDGTGTNGLWFASAAVTNRPNGNFPSDQIEISRFSGRVRYAGIVTNSTNF